MEGILFCDIHDSDIFIFLSIFVKIWVLGVSVLLRFIYKFD